MSISKYVKEDEFKMIIIDNKIDLVNYIEIDSFDDEKIVVRHESGIVALLGECLTISKLMDKEMLISGKIEKIEFR